MPDVLIDVPDGATAAVRCEYPGCGLPLTDPVSRARRLGPEHDPQPRGSTDVRPRRTRQGGPDLLAELAEPAPDPIAEAFERGRRVGLCAGWDAFREWRITPEMAAILGPGRVTPIRPLAD